MCKAAASGDAWALRNIADAGWIAPDGHSAAAYFAEKVRNNIAQRIARMYGPPEHNKIGARGVRTTEDARIQNPPNPHWMVTAPWEEDYLLWSLHHLVELGYAEAARPPRISGRLKTASKDRVLNNFPTWPFSGRRYGDPRCVVVPRSHSRPTCRRPLNSKPEIGKLFGARS